MSIHTDVLCAGHASYDLTFSVDHHPAADEKTTATHFMGCGGGPAANAAVTVARMGLACAFSGYLGNDIYGRQHCDELCAEGINIDLVQRGNAPTPLSTIWVKPDGARTLVNYKTPHLCLPELSPPALLSVYPKAMLFDGHEPLLSQLLLERARLIGAATVLDAGSLHAGTEQLYAQVDYLVCSEKFAQQITGGNLADTDYALKFLGERSPCVVITLGERGLIWRRGIERGALPAYDVDAVDTTGAGDAFHGAFTAGLAAGYEWHALLRLASAAGALCCMRLGARPAMPTRQEIDDFLAKQ